MVNGLPDVDPKRKAKLLEVLDIDLDWRMHLVSDGQRRRVQLLMGLLKPFQVLLTSRAMTQCVQFRPGRRESKMGSVRAASESWKAIFPMIAVPSEAIQSQPSRQSLSRFLRRRT